MKQVSEFLHLNFKDLVKGMIIAFLTTALQTLLSILESGGTFPSGDEWKTISIVSVTSMIAYLIKNWLTNSDDQFLKKEQA